MATNEELKKAARRLLDCFAPGMVVTVGGQPIAHGELNDAREALDKLLKDEGY